MTDTTNMIEVRTFDAKMNAIDTAYAEDEEAAMSAAKWLVRDHLDNTPSYGTARRVNVKFLRNGVVLLSATDRDLRT